jgi:hypothetical protein
MDHTKFGVSAVDSGFAHHYYSSVVFSTTAGAAVDVENGQATKFGLEVLLSLVSRIIV